jgi:hypothetical protein
MCAALSLPVAPLASADPELPPPQPALADAPPPPPDGAVPSEAPSSVDTPDGWHLTVTASNETQVAVSPLTTSIASREYMAGGTFTGAVTGNGKSTLAGGTLEIGFQIGCGIMAERVKLYPSVGIATSHTLGGLLPTGVSFPITGAVEVTLRAGDVNLVSIDKKAFKGTDAQINMKDVHIKIDGCGGQSFLRSYAVLTSATDSTNDIVAYYGVTKVV